MSGWAELGPLLLVNASHPLDEELRPELVPPDSSRPEIRLERRAAGLLAACLQAVGGQGKILPVSGWRSRAEQQAIWDDTMAREGERFTRSYVARPGCSEHETGLAIDLGLAGPELDFIRPYFPDSGVCGAFRERAAEYGFILRYPKGKERVTGIAHEPWHFRSVGVPHAQLMAEQGLVLEEYLERLESYTAEAPLCVRGARYDYAIFSQRRVRPSLEDGQGSFRQVSGDNLGGWIVTAWQSRRG